MSIPQPQFFDIFGILVFGFIIVLAVWGLRFRRPLPRWSLFFLFAVGIAGLFVDGYIVFTTYFY
ncbi:MAG: hypothetical protein HYW90_01770 [Candidatus Sungbacteria bacterium]|nr:hypothetical protein [Candidatus Sungbacteria bacterium]